MCTNCSTAFWDNQNVAARKEKRTFCIFTDASRTGAIEEQGKRNSRSRYGKVVTLADSEISNGYPRVKTRTLRGSTPWTHGWPFWFQENAASVGKNSILAGNEAGYAKWCWECQTCFVNNSHSVSSPPLKPIVVARPSEIMDLTC
ncbi:hypothetical protein COOONC_28096 [Cooperia oncophora]